MNKALQDQLYVKYPKIFANKDKSMQESCMFWGIECNDGWYNILDTLCEAVTHTYTTSIEIDEERAKQWGIEPTIWKDEPKPRYFLDVGAPQVVADQVKEKFGTLRFYYHLEFELRFREVAYGDNPIPDASKTADRYSDYIDGIIHMAETMSSRTCEDTGLPGELHVSGGTRRGWYRTLNREYAKTNEFCASRNYVPVADLPKEENE
jgi:hypothetical protein